MIRLSKASRETRSRAVDIDLNAVPRPVDRLNHVRIACPWGGNFSVETAECQPSGYLPYP